MLEAIDVTYKVGGRELISGISVLFAPGKLHLIVGPNGAGKSTLIKVLARYLRPQIGRVEYDGIDVANTGEADLAKRRAVLSQAVEAAFPLTAREIVMMGRYPHFGGRPGPVDEKIVDEMMELFDVAEFADRNYQTLSGGERQRVNFARVLAQIWIDREHSSHDGLGPRYLFLDEPLTFLDIRHQLAFMKMVKDFASHADVVTVGVVHDLNLAGRFADDVVMLHEGRVKAVGAAVDVLTSENIRNVFGVEPSFIPAAGVGTHLIFD